MEYDRHKYNGLWDQGNWQQSQIFGDVNLVYSPWGATSGFVKADISNDFGLDPRAIAYGAYTVTPNGYYFHNYIYQYTSGTPSQNAASATHNIALDFGPSGGVNNPISVTVNHGLHSFVVSGVYASSDPSIGNETLFGVDTWDPFVGFGASINPTREVVWSLTEWTTNLQLWGSTYSSNGGGDPDPSTPTNYYNPPFPAYGNQQHHWIGYYVSIEEDATAVCNTAGPNYSLNQLGQPSPHNGTC